MTSTGAAPVKVLYIGGYSRSGSTLLDCMLGQLPGFFSTGELAYVWTHGLDENRLCGCGSRFLDCPFWTEVGQVAFGGWERIDLEQMLALERAVNRHRFVPLLLAPRVSSRYRGDLQRYADVLARLYHAIHVVGGTRVIIDSTIDPAYGYLLRRVPGLDVRLLHLVRDSRATAFSWTRWQLRTDRVDTVMYQRRIRPASTAVRWSVYHLLVQLLGTVGPSALFARYEDVVAAPAEQIRRIVRHLDEELDESDLSFIRDGAVELGTTHTVAGSLMRLKQGALPLRLDDEWATALPARDRRVVTLLSLPLLRRYGYPAAATRGGSSG